MLGNDGASHRRRDSAHGRDAARALLAVLLVTLTLASPAAGSASAPGGLPLQGWSDLGALYADGTTLVDALDSFEQANVYQFQVTSASGAAHIYVGDLWYDVDVSLWQAAAVSGNPAQWRAMTCEGGAGCLASAPPSARRRVQLVQPKTLMVPVEAGTYALVIRPSSAGDFSPWRQYTLRVAATPPLCAVASDPEGRYTVGLSMVPEHPRRADLVTLTAYVLPPFVDLFDVEWTVDGRSLGDGPSVQAWAFSLGTGRGGPHEVQAVARGARPYPDPDQPDVPPTIAASCSLAVG